MRAQTAAVKPFDVSRLEEEVREATQQHPQHPLYIQPLERAPRIAAPVPDYVSHREDTSEIGKLSAEAIVKEYEETAKEIEAMGDVVKEMVQRSEQLVASANTMLK